MKRFVAFLEPFYSYLVHALQKQNEIELMKIAIHGLSDVSASVGTNFSKYLPEIIPALVICLKVFYSFFIGNIYSFIRLLVLIEKLN